MQFVYSPYILPLLSAALVSLLVSVYIWPRRRMSGTTALMWLSIAIVAWSLGYALEIAAVGLPAKLILGKAQYIAITFVPVIWLVFTHNHFRPEKRWRLPTILLLSIIPLATIGLVFTT